ncbi:MAG: hypothetical protein IIB62_05395 [Proteobacteria bacterium]|nr:hypothetical protein [Pseudomonadota bacterium]
MSRKGRGKGSVPAVSPSNDRLHRWVMRANGLAGMCLLVLVAIELFGFSTPQLRALLMVGIAAAGTVAWVQQARRKCPNCGQLYGYHLRILKGNICRKCGTELAKWDAGHLDGEAEK